MNRNKISRICFHILVFSIISPVSLWADAGMSNTEALPADSDKFFRSPSPETHETLDISPYLHDLSLITPITYNENDFIRFNEDRDLKYSASRPFRIPLLQRFLNYLSGRFGPVFINRALPVVFYILVTGATISLLFWFLRGNLETFWQPDLRDRTAPLSDVEENIMECDLGILIQKEISLKKYNRAIRLLYLQCLQRLAQNNIIQLEKSKTNAAYLAEVRPHGFSRQFSELIRIYEYAWFGHQIIDSAVFEYIQRKYNEFQHGADAK